MQRFINFVASLPESVPGWAWGFAAGVLVAVVGPAAGLIALVAGLVYLALLALVPTTPEGHEYRPPPAPEAVARCRRQCLRLCGAGLVAALAGLAARTASDDVIQRFLWLVNAILVLTAILAARVTLRKGAARDADASEVSR